MPDKLLASRILASKGTTCEDTQGAMRVAVIGGGVSGAFCAYALRASDYAVTMFDMGRSGPGAQASERAACCSGAEAAEHHETEPFDVWPAAWRLSADSVALSQMAAMNRQTAHSCHSQRCVGL